MRREEVDRRRLPAFRRRKVVDPALDVREQREPFEQHEQTGAPPGAPNVLLVVLDDMGFGASSAFGGPCEMPTAEGLAEEGLRYSRFHTCAVCSPTRAALLTGRNHHAVGMGSVPEVATSSPGYDAIRPASAATLAQTLRYNGYATAAFGKWHQTPPWEQGPTGPFDRWPTHEGFDRFYGFMSGEANQFSPNLVENTTFIDPPAGEEQGYHLSEDIVDRAIEWIREVRAFGGTQPWFAFLAFGATHAPFQVPEAWRDRNRGDFAHGWDEQRERTFARQKELGIVPADAELGAWPDAIPPWEELDDTRRLAAERLMELYASFAEHADVQVGRLIAALRERGELDDTLVLYLLGDNGAAPTGGAEGAFNVTLHYNGMNDSAEHIVENLDQLGGPHSYAEYPLGWALAMDTPYQWMKGVASHYGGTRNGLVVHWPDGIAARGEIRHQWHHVIDVAPTILEAIGLPHPDQVDGIEQDPIHGTSFAYSFDDPDAAERHTTQYFEIMGNRGIYHEGWTAVTKHAPFPGADAAGSSGFERDHWELYDTRSDWTQARDIAAAHPGKLAELQDLFLSEARRYNVLPLDDRGTPRFDAEVAGRPVIPTARSVVLPGTAGHLREHVVPNVKNRSHEVVVELEASTAESDGVLVAQGGRFAGWSLYVKAGILTYAYNLAGIESTAIGATEPLPVGRHRVAMRFDYDGGGWGKGGEVSLLLDGRPIGSGRVERTIPFFFSTDQGLDVGIDRGSPVTEDYSRNGGSPYDGAIESVRITTADNGEEVASGDLLEAMLAQH